MLDIAPRSSFVVGTGSGVWRAMCAACDSRACRPTTPLLLLEREVERPLEPAERSRRRGLCVALGGHPLRILRAAAVIRDCNVPIGEWTNDLVPRIACSGASWRRSTTGNDAY